MDQGDLPDFLRLNGLRERPGMFGGRDRLVVPAKRLPRSLAAVPDAIPFAPVPPMLPVGNPTFDPTVGGALGIPSPGTDLAPVAASATATRKPAYRVPPPEVIAAAQSKQRRWGVPASVSLAQWAVEGKWGEGMPKDSNNPFGMKAIPGQPSVRAWTKEYVGGKLTSVQKDFRKYASLEDAWEARSKMLATSRLYAKARPHLNDPDAFVDAIASTYAPNNPTYSATLKGIMKHNHFYQYNNLPPEAAQ
jgi:hypothetical protein